jgi:hypothetical protein
MNIFIRKQDDDLCKYLSDEDRDHLLSQCENRSLKAGDIIQAKVQPAILILKSGQLKRHNAQATPVGIIYPGEIDFEAGLFREEALDYYIQASLPSELILCPYHTIQAITNVEVQAQIQAAINDSLCQKITQITHGNNNEESE